MATRGSMPNISAVRAEEMAISAIRGIGIGIDSAVAIDQYAGGQADKKNRGDDQGIRGCADDLQCRPDGLGRGVAAPDTMPWARP